MLRQCVQQAGQWRPDGFRTVPPHMSNWFGPLGDHPAHMPGTVEQSDRPPSVPALDRALTLLECLARSRKGYSVSELSRRLALPKSSVHLILRTFERRGYLQKQITGGRYRFGLKLVSLGRMALEGVEVRDEARPVLARLVRATGLTAHMGILERSEVVIIERLDSVSPDQHSPLSLQRLARTSLRETGTQDGGGIMPRSREELQHVKPQAVAASSPSLVEALKHRPSLALGRPNVQTINVLAGVGRVRIPGRCCRPCCHDVSFASTHSVSTAS